MWKETHKLGQRLRAYILNADKLTVFVHCCVIVWRNEDNNKDRQRKVKEKCKTKLILTNIDHTCNKSELFVRGTIILYQKFIDFIWVLFMCIWK